jgi:putative SOS response-associated peptidase YedK
VFGIAALWDRSVISDEDDVIESCAMLTVVSNTLLTEVNGVRMPAILNREDYGTWLNSTPEVAHSLLRAHPAAQMVAHAVSPRINSLKYDDAELIASVAQRATRCA